MQDLETKEIPDGQFQNTGLDREKLVKRAGALKAEMLKWQPTWQDLQTYLYPSKGFFNATTPNQGSQIDHKTLVDEEATIDLDTFGAGMTSGFTSPARPWFRLYLGDEDLMDEDKVKWWLQEVQKRIYSLFQKSNTYSILTTMYIELGAFGTACALVEEDFETGIHLTNYTIGEYALGRDERGRTNAFYRVFWLTAGQMVQKFGIENCSESVQTAFKQGNVDGWNKVQHLIEENDERNPLKGDNQNMLFRSVYWQDNKEDKYLKISGYEELPILAPRFETTTSADVYGKGAGWKALGSVKELQIKVKNLLVAIEKGANPPLQTDASVTGEVNTLPGGITKTSSVSPNGGVRSAYEVRLDIASLDLSIEKTRQKIKKAFYADLFLMMLEAERGGTPITATEVAERQSERISKIGPILELWQGDEFIKTLLDRTFAIGIRNGLFPEAPEEIQGMELKIQYTSILAQAQKMMDIQAIDIWSAGVLQDAGANPDVLDIIDFDEKHREKAEMLGVPPKIVRSLLGVAEKRKQKAEQFAAAEKNNQMLQAVEAAGKGAKAVKDIAGAKMGEDNALDRTLDSIKEMNK